MELLDIIKKRRSVRTFDGRVLEEVDRHKIEKFIEDVPNPYGIPVRFVLLDAEEKGLSSPVISGAPLYVAAVVGKVPHGEEAFGCSFEKFVLFAESLGLGTTWIGGTMNRSQFEKAAGLGKDERMCCISPLGYPAAKMSLRETLMRKGVKADARFDRDKLFFEGSFGAALKTEDSVISAALEAVRLAPSAVNKQPWRIVKTDSRYHFFLKHDKGYVSNEVGDMQKIDMGIALCHFMSIAGGGLVIQDPGIELPENTEYIATVVL